jgi:hypothetical protein
VRLESRLVRLVVLFADGSLTVMVVEQASLGVCAVWVSPEKTSLIVVTAGRGRR